MRPPYRWEVPAWGARRIRASGARRSVFTPLVLMRAVGSSKASSTSSSSRRYWRKHPFPSRSPFVTCRPARASGTRSSTALFSFITQNWRGKPLITPQVIVNLIAATTTKKGLTVRSRIDERIYPNGRRVSDKELALVNLEPNAFHGEWNYTIRPSVPQ